MNAITPDMTINEVVNKYPETMKVFNAHKFDTCCGGHENIAIAAATNGANIPKLITELNAVVKAKG